MLTAKERSTLRSIANGIKPNINIGKNGIADNIIEEIKTTLFHNELAKVSVLKACEVDKATLIEQICKLTECECVQQIGNKIVLYKFTEKKEFEHLLNSRRGAKQPLRK
ncbi:MAG: YhbY family RNA-binding protein [Clostridia bacterium]